jgi:hypothetical protein
MADFTTTLILKHSFWCKNHTTKNDVEDEVDSQFVTPSESLVSSNFLLGPLRCSALFTDEELRGPYFFPVLMKRIIAPYIYVLKTCDWSDIYINSIPHKW